MGGREYAWNRHTFAKSALFLDRLSKPIGWLAILAGLTCLVLEVLRYLRPAKFVDFPNEKLGYLEGSFWVQFLKTSGFSLALVVCAAILIWVFSSCLYLFFMRSKPGHGDQVRSIGNPQPATETTKQPGHPVSAVPKDVGQILLGGADPKSAESGVKPTEQEAKKAEQEAKKAEQERRKNKIDNARKEFEKRAGRFRDSIKRSYELKVAGDVLDFSEAIKATPLKVVMREGGLRSYLSWDPDALTIKVSDPFAFFKDGKVRFCFDFSDPEAALDEDLKHEIKSQSLEVLLSASCPSVAQRFFDWKAKVLGVIRLDNAKQGQSVDYDIKALVGFDPEWAVWTRAEGLEPLALQADFEGHRIKGEPTVGSDFRLRLGFACRGCEELTHELDLLLTCNMDPEMRWRDIERDQSDDDPVVSEDARYALGKMAEAVSSTPTAYKLRIPDDVFSKPNRVSRRQRLGDFDLAYASIRGRSHIKSGSFREDDVQAQFFLEGKAVAVVVSDGAGSAPLSRRGSLIVAEVGITHLVELGQKLAKDPEALKARTPAAIEGFASVVQAIRAQIKFEAECIQQSRPDFQPKEMHATFLAALVLPTPSGHVLLSYSVGDGAIGLGQAGPASGIKCVPDHGQSAGQTLFILSNGAEDAERRLVFAELPESYALLLMSDGVSDPRFSNGSEMNPEAWEELSRDLLPKVKSEPAEQGDERVETYKERGPLCAWLDSYEKGHHDDRTIAVLLHKIS